MEKEGIEKLRDLIDWFFSDPGIRELRIDFGKPVTIPKGEFYGSIVGNYDSNGGVSEGNVYIDTFTYDEEYIDNNEKVHKILAKMMVEYGVVKETNEIEIRRIEMWRDPQ